MNFLPSNHQKTSRKPDRFPFSDNPKSLHNICPSNDRNADILFPKQKQPRPCVQILSKFHKYPGVRHSEDSKKLVYKGFYKDLIKNENPWVHTQCSDSSKDTIDRAYTYEIVDMLEKPFNDQSVKMVIEKTLMVKDMNK